MVNVPQATVSRGTTKILNEGAVERVRPRPAPRRRDEGSHADAPSAFGVVYVNDVGREAMLTKDGSKKFPAGSIIVREKLSKADGARPDLLVVMVKRAPGFNPPGGDWEFLTVESSLAKVRDRQKKGECLDCHASQKNRDFVFPLPATR